MCDGQYSCNKTYLNTSIDIENLAGEGLTNCKLSFYGTAHATSGGADGFNASAGLFERTGGLYRPSMRSKCH